MTNQIPAIVLTAILSPMLCVVTYLFWKSQRVFKKTLRKIEQAEFIKNDWEVRAAIVGLITEKMKDDYLFQQAIVTLVIEQLQKDWKLEKAVVSIVKKAS